MLEVLDNSKVIFIDWGVFIHRAIFAGRNNPSVPPAYTAMSMLIASLKRIGVSRKDIVIIATDSPLGSWRREIDSNYKSNRKALREQQKDINWTKEFDSFDRLLSNIEVSTPFHTIQLNKLEADDIIAYGVRFYKDMKSIIVSTDSDFEQLKVLSNVSLYSPFTKHFKIVKNPQRVLAKKIVREVTDNLVSPILNKNEYEKRYQIVNLLSLPQWVEESIHHVLSNLNLKKEFEIDKLFFRNIRKRFVEIYNNDKVIKESDTLDYEKKKKEKRKINQLKKNQTTLL